MVLLDEPSSGIAQREVEALAPVLRRLRDEMGASLLVIEHDIPLVSSISDRLVALDQGAVLTSGRPVRRVAPSGRDRELFGEQHSGAQSAAATGGRRHASSQCIGCVRSAERGQPSDETMGAHRRRRRRSSLVGGGVLFATQGDDDESVDAGGDTTAAETTRRRRAPRHRVPTRNTTDTGAAPAARSRSR